MLHQPVDCVLCCIKGGDEGLFNILTCNFFGLEVQIHLENEEKRISLMYINVFPVLLSVAIILYLVESVTIFG